MSGPQFTSGRQLRDLHAVNEAADVDAVLPSDWRDRPLVATRDVRDEMFIEALIAYAPDDCVLLCERETIHLLAERATLSQRPKLAKCARTAGNLFETLRALRPPIARGPIFVQATSFLDDLQFRARSLIAKTKMIAGYELDRSILADAIAGLVQSDFSNEIDVRTAATVVQAGRRVLPPSLLVASGHLASVEATPDVLSDWQELVFASADPMQDPPSMQSVTEHARFLADTDQDLLADLHRPLQNAACREIFDIWKLNLGILKQDRDRPPTVDIALQRLDELTPETE